MASALRRVAALETAALHCLGAEAVSDAWRLRYPVDGAYSIGNKGSYGRSSMPYQRTLALSDDPFAPKWVEVDDNEKITQIDYLANLEVAPLRVDRCKLVERLYCEKISSFHENEAKFVGFLNSLGYAQKPISRGINSGMAIIYGDAGYGKTTLASRFVKLILEIVPVGQPHWSCVEVAFPSTEIGESLTEDDIKASISILREKVLSQKEGTHISILVDDVTSASMGALASAYNEFKRYPKILVATTNEPQLFANNTKIRLEKFNITPYEADDAVQYARYRIEQFRDPRTAQLVDELPLFPFTEEAVRRWVGKTDRGRPLTLRVLNKHLSEKIRQSSNCYTRDGNDVGQMNLAQLRTLLDDCMRPDHNCGRAEHG